MVTAGEFATDHCVENYVRDRDSITVVSQERVKPPAVRVYGGPACLSSAHR